MLIYYLPVIIASILLDQVDKVDTEQQLGETLHHIPNDGRYNNCYTNQFILDDQGFVGKVVACSEDGITLQHFSEQNLMQQRAWGLTPRDIYQALALQTLLDPEIHLVNLTGAAGSGKTILALAAAIEMTIETQQYNRIIAMRSTQMLDQDIGFLPGTEEEKMQPWLGAITDNLEALHSDDENTAGSIDYLLSRVPLQFKSLNYIRGRSFQRSIILLDECQNFNASPNQNHYH